MRSLPCAWRDSLIDYSLAIVERTRQHEQLSLGVSPVGG